MFYQDDIVENNLIRYMKGTDFFETLIKYNNYFIFGGAIRDAFNNKNECDDIDILCIDENLQLPFATQLADVNGSMCGLNKDSRDIKLAGSRFRYDNKLKVDIMYPIKIEHRNIVGLFNVINSVDMSVSGIAYHHTFKFIEVVPSAIEYCKRKIFRVNTNVDGYNGNTEDRINKLIKLGYLRVN